MEKLLILLARAYVAKNEESCSKIYHQIHLELMSQLNLEHKCTDVEIMSTNDLFKVTAFWEKQSDICEKIRTELFGYRFVDCGKHGFYGDKFSVAKKSILIGVLEQYDSIVIKGA